MDNKEFRKWASAEAKASWKINKAKIEQQLKGTKINFSIWLLLEKVHELGVYSGIDSHIRYEAIEELKEIEPPQKK